VPGELARHPGAVDLTFGGVVEDVELDGPAEELAHRAISNTDIGIRVLRDCDRL
jgi:hypothetical protein